MEDNTLKDAYQLFMNKFNISEEEFIQFGIQETIVIEPSIIEKEWNKLKSNILYGENVTFVRGYGRDAKGTRLYMDLYNYLFNHNFFEKDGTNNAKPKKLLEDCTGFKRSERISEKYNQIRNYQVSHVFGRTKNPYAFTAPWNLAFVPKIVDPFTGHESKGELTNNFAKKFNNYFFEKNKDFIEEFNSIMTDLHSKIDYYLANLSNTYGDEITETILHKFKMQVLLDFKPIQKLE